MTFLTRFALVLLRIAIGWHFLFEGLEKLDSYFRGPADGKSVWTSEHYLRESTGPLRSFFRAQAGDLNEAALERLTVPANEPGKLPPALETDWKEYYERFVAFYGLANEKSVKLVPPEFLHALAASPQQGFPANIPWAAVKELDKLDKGEPSWIALDTYAKAEAGRWLIAGKREVTKSFSKIAEKVTEKTPDRIKAYRDKLAQLAAIETSGLPGMGKDVWKRKLATLKDEINKMRTELLADLNQPMNKAMEFTFAYRLTDKQRDKLPIEYRGKALLPPGPRKATLVWIDQLTMWVVTGVGVCLLLGLFTRTACIAGAGFLLSFYLALPALPWLPVNPRAEGHYLYINKNLIEMLALLALATTQSGRWAGLDGLIYAINPWRRASKNSEDRGSKSE